MLHAVQTVSPCNLQMPQHAQTAWPSRVSPQGSGNTVKEEAGSIYDPEDKAKRCGRAAFRLNTTSAIRNSQLGPMNSQSWMGQGRFLLNYQLSVDLEKWQSLFNCVPTAEHGKLWQAAPN